MRDRKRSFWSAFMIGVGLFYDLATPAVGLASDGLLHAAELLVVVAAWNVFAVLLLAVGAGLLFAARRSGGEPESARG